MVISGGFLGGFWIILSGSVDVLEFFVILGIARFIVFQYEVGLQITPSISIVLVLFPGGSRQGGDRNTEVQTGLFLPEWLIETLHPRALGFSNVPDSKVAKRIERRYFRRSRFLVADSLPSTLKGNTS